MERCICGNKLRETKLRITTSPCKCEVKGPGRSTMAVARAFNLDQVGETQFNQRRRLGLPVQAPCEMGSLESGTSEDRDPVFVPVADD